MASEAPTGVLLDVDRTDVDSTYFHTVSWWQAFRQLGLTVSTTRIETGPRDNPGTSTAASARARRLTTLPGR